MYVFVTLNCKELSNHKMFKCFLSEGLYLWKIELLSIFSLNLGRSHSPHREKKVAFCEKKKKLRQVG